AWASRGRRVGEDWLGQRMKFVRLCGGEPVYAPRADRSLREFPSGVAAFGQSFQKSLKWCPSTAAPARRTAGRDRGTARARQRLGCFGVSVFRARLALSIVHVSVRPHVLSWTVAFRESGWRP